MIDVLRIAHLRIAPQEGNLEVGNCEGNHIDKEMDILAQQRSTHYAANSEHKLHQMVDSTVSLSPILSTLWVASALVAGTKKAQRYNGGQIGGKISDRIFSAGSGV